MNVRSIGYIALGVITLLIAPAVAAQEERAFGAGSLVIPMDVDYQDDGMLQAYGLLYQLLLADVTVYWVIDPDKEPGGVDVEVAAEDWATGEAITDIDPESEEPTGRHGYRGGPFVIDASAAETAAATVDAWQASHTTAVHQASEAFVADVSRTLTVAPTIAVFADGHEDIAFDYLNAAAIPDSLGQAWPERREGDLVYEGFPDVLNVDEVRGPTISNDADGALFDDQGLPVYCQIMTMHWGVNERDDEAIAEFRSFLQYPTHFMAECQAVNAVENSVNGRFLTPNGYLIGDQPDEVEVVAAHLPFSQFDGDFETENGSEPAYSLPEGDEYYDMGVVMLTELGTGIGENDVWMTGFVDGACFIDPKNPDEAICESRVGKVSYLGGHHYSVDTPISEHPHSQGTRLFLNSLFEADCVTTVGQPGLTMTLGAPAVTREPQFGVGATVANEAIGIALDVVAVIALPEGVSLVDASPEPTTVDGAELSWDIGNLGHEDEVTFALTVRADAPGELEHGGWLDFRVGQNERTETAAPVTTLFDPDAVVGDDDQGDLVDRDAGFDTGDGDAGTGGDAGADADADGRADGNPDGGPIGPGLDLDDDGTGPVLDTSSGGGQATAEEGCGCMAAQTQPPSALLLLAAALYLAVRRSRANAE